MIKRIIYHLPVDEEIPSKIITQTFIFVRTSLAYQTAGGLGHQHTREPPKHFISFQIRIKSKDVKYFNIDLTLYQESQNMALLDFSRVTKHNYKVFLYKRRAHESPHVPVTGEESICSILL